MNILLRTGCFSAQAAPVMTGARLFHGSAAMFALPKKKLKPKQPVYIDKKSGQPLWWVKREDMKKKKVELAQKFQELAMQPVIHMQTTKPQAWVTDLNQTPLDIVDLNPEVWTQEIRKDIVQRVVRWQQNSWRQGTAKGKTRGEVRGGGAKPRPQKGTGQARQGSIRSPLWPGGGKAFPPKPRDFSHDLPVKVVRKGLMIALTAKYQEGNVYVVDGCTLDSHHTRELAQLFRHWTVGQVAFIHGIAELDPNFALAARNIPFLELYSPRAAGVYQVVKRNQVVITRQGLRELESHLLQSGRYSPTHPRGRHLAPLVREPTPLSELYLEVNQ